MGGTWLLAAPHLEFAGRHPLPPSGSPDQSPTPDTLASHPRRCRLARAHATSCHLGRLPCVVHHAPAQTPPPPRHPCRRTAPARGPVRARSTRPRQARQHAAVRRGEHDRPLAAGNAANAVVQPSFGPGIPRARNTPRRETSAPIPDRPQPQVPACNRSRKAAASIDSTRSLSKHKGTRHMCHRSSHSATRISSGSTATSGSICCIQCTVIVGADTVVIHQDDARTPGSGVLIGLLHQLSAGNMLIPGTCPAAYSAASARRTGIGCALPLPANFAVSPGRCR